MASPEPLHAEIRRLSELLGALEADQREALRQMTEQESRLADDVSTLRLDVAAALEDLKRTLEQRLSAIEARLDALERP